MSQPDLKLYHFPGACSRVAVCALEMAGLDYTLELVNLAKGEQSGPAYLTVSPLGKVPLLLADGEPLTENIAILTYIADLRPDSGVFPGHLSSWARAEVAGGLSFCAGTLHSQIRGLANPSRITDGEVDGVRAKSRELVGKSFAYAERRLTDRGWWVGEQSIADVYLDWAVFVARNAGFDLTAFPILGALTDGLLAMPAYTRMQAEEAGSRAALGL